jgi:hypothetical protein
VSQVPGYVDLTATVIYSFISHGPAAGGSYSYPCSLRHLGRVSIALSQLPITVIYGSMCTTRSIVSMSRLALMVLLVCQYVVKGEVSDRFVTVPNRS